MCVYMYIVAGIGMLTILSDMPRTLILLPHSGYNYFEGLKLIFAVFAE